MDMNCPIFKMVEESDYSSFKKPMSSLYLYNDSESQNQMKVFNLGKREIPYFKEHQKTKVQKIYETWKRKNEIEPNELYIKRSRVKFF